MASLIYKVYDGSKVTDTMLQEASQLFSSHYGVWGQKAASVIGAWAKEGSRVRLNATRLRAQCLPKNAQCSYAQAIIDDKLVGNAFACRWEYDNKSVCWITQLVVHREYRARGIAGCLLSMLRKNEDDIYGIASSHPAACMAAARAFGDDPIESIKLEFAGFHAREIMKASPIDYIRNAKPHGCIFDADIPTTDGTVSCVDTGFFVDHKEPFEALGRACKSIYGWPLGELLDGFEFLLIVEARRRTRDRKILPLQ